MPRGPAGSEETGESSAARQSVTTFMAHPRVRLLTHHLTGFGPGACTAGAAVVGVAATFVVLDRGRTRPRSDIGVVSGRFDARARRWSASCLTASLSFTSSCA